MSRGTTWRTTTRVEVIPWIHAAGNPMHDAIIRYVEKIPPGSYLALEASSKELARFHEYIDKAPEYVTQFWTGRPSFLLPEVPRAGVELVFVCRKKSIHLLPLEDAKTKDETLQLMNTGIATHDVLNSTREPKFIERSVRIVDQLTAKKVPVLYVIVGAAHGYTLYSFLKRNRVPANMPLNKIFGASSRVMRRIVTLSPHLAKAERENDAPKLAELDREMNRLLDQADGKIWRPNNSDYEATRRLFSGIVTWMRENPSSPTPKRAPPKRVTKVVKPRVRKPKKR